MALWMLPHRSSSIIHSVEKQFYYMSCSLNGLTEMWDTALNKVLVLPFVLSLVLQSSKRVANTSWAIGISLAHILFVSSRLVQITKPLQLKERKKHSSGIKLIFQIGLEMFYDTIEYLPLAQGKMTSVLHHPAQRICSHPCLKTVLSAPKHVFSTLKLSICSG